MKKFFADFKKFISKGNVIDLAVAVVIGNAFNAIVNNLVNKIIMPLISVLTGGVNISSWKIIITPANEELGVLETSIMYGEFLQAIVNFLIIAISVFVVIRFMNKARENFSSLNNIIRKNYLSKEEKLEMKKMGLNPKKKADVQSFIETQEKALQEKNKQLEEQEKLKAEQEKINNPSEKELLKQIRDLLIESKSGSSSKTNEITK